MKRMSFFLLLVWMMVSFSWGISNEISKQRWERINALKDKLLKNLKYQPVKQTVSAKESIKLSKLNKFSQTIFRKEKKVAKTVRKYFQSNQSLKVKREEAQQNLKRDYPSAKIKEVLTLKKAVKLALKNNPTLKVIKKMMESKDKEWQAVRKSLNGFFEWEVSATGTTEPGNAAFFRVREGAFDQNYQLYEMNDPSATVWDIAGVVRYMKPLDTGGRIAAEMGIKEYEKAVLKAKWKQAREEIAYNVVKSFLNILMIESRIEVTKESIEVSKRHLKLVGDLFKKGLAVKSDYLNANVRVLKYQQDLKRLKNQLEVAKNALIYAMGYSRKDTDFRIENIACINRIVGDKKELIDEAYRNRWDLKELKLELKRLNYMIKKVRSQLKINSNAIVSYEINNNEEFDYDGNGYLVGIKCVQRFGDSGMINTQIKALKKAKKAILRKIEAIKQKIKFEITQSYFDVENTRTLLPLADKTIESAQESLKLIEDRYNNGLVKFIEVMDADLELNQAKQRRVILLHQNCQSFAALRYTIGNLVEEVMKL